MLVFHGIFVYVTTSSLICLVVYLSTKSQLVVHVDMINIWIVYYYNEITTINDIVCFDLSM